MVARHHHYLPQFYLKGFTYNGSKKSKLSVIDIKENKYFVTTPRNVGGVRDFNTINIDGFERDAIEGTLSDFEGKAATAIKELENGAEFKDERKEIVLSLIALLSTRSPERREHLRKFNEELMKKVMALTVANKSRWESVTKKMNKNKTDTIDNISYEDVKKFVDDDQYKINLSNEHHIKMEIISLETVLPFLLKRKWLLIKTTEESGPFITTDNPTILTWKNPDTIPPFYRNSPGFGLLNTQIFFHLSKNIALIGEFDGQESVFPADKQLVASLNSIMMGYAYKQLYSPKLGFYYKDEKKGIVEGSNILQLFSKK
jgi:hypothetical protein